MTQDPENSPGKLVILGTLPFDKEEGAIHRNGRWCVLPPTLAKILAILVEAAPRTVSKAVLLDTVWPDSEVSEAALTQRVKELRRRLGDNAREPRLVGTVRGRGYRLLETVQPAAAVQPLQQRWQGCRTGSSAAGELLERALGWADRFEWRKAADLLGEAVRLDPGFALAWVWLAVAQLWLEAPRAARKAIRRASSLVAAGSGPERHFILAVRASFAGKLAEAIDHLELLLELQPDNFWAAYRLAQLYLAAGRTEDSLSLRRRAESLRPDHAFNLAEAGLTRLFGAFDLEGAAEEYRRVLELDPNHPFALPFLAPSFQAWLAGDLATAGEILAQVMDRRLDLFLPLGRVSALVHGARFRLFVGDATAARADLDAALSGLARGSSVDGWTRLEYALTLRDVGDVAGAESQLASVVGRGTTLFRAHAIFWRGVIAAAGGDLDALDHCLGALHELPAAPLSEFGVPVPMVRERIRRQLPRLLLGEKLLVCGDCLGALPIFSEVATALPVRMDAPLPLVATGPRLHVAAREGQARALAAAGRLEEALEIENWLVAQRLLLFVVAQGGVGAWFAALARRASLLWALGRREEALRDAEAVRSRWGHLDPPPPVLRTIQPLLAHAGTR